MSGYLFKLVGNQTIKYFYDINFVVPPGLLGYLEDYNGEFFIVVEVTID